MGENPQHNGTAAAFATLRKALDDAADMPPSAAKTAAIRYLAEEIQDIYGTATALRKAELLRLREADPRLTFAELGALVGVTKGRVDQILKAAQKEAAASGPSSDRPERPVIVSAIVTSDRRVLISRRRNEPDLPWAFIGGEIEPGESPADAAVREVKEETGLRIAAGKEIGRRIHPVTSRWIVYIEAAPQGGTDAFVGDTEELAEVRWVTPAEADKLTGNTIYEPVRVHLRRVARRNR
jgi:8-oxo-dGTP pyrophosphatase MutT (NUDIX family)